MNRLLLVTLFFFAYTAALADDDESCRQSAELVGDARGPFTLPVKCRELALEQAAPEHTLYFQSGTIKTVAGNNFIFTLRPELQPLDKKNPVMEELLLAGEQTLLSDIASISVNWRSKRLIVVDGQQSVKTFDYLGSGNIAPLHHLQSPEVMGASFALTNEKNHILAVAIPEEGKIKFFKEGADVNGRKPENDMTLLMTLETSQFGITSPEQLAFNPKTDQLLVYDLKHRKVLTLHWGKKFKAQGPVVTFTLEDHPLRIDFHDDEKMFAGLYPKNVLKVFSPDLKSGKRQPASVVDWKKQYSQHAVRQKKIKALEENLPAGD